MGAAQPLQCCQGRDCRGAAVELEFEDEPSVEEAVSTWKDSATEFADCLIDAPHRAFGCRATALDEGHCTASNDCDGH